MKNVFRKSFIGALIALPIFGAGPVSAGSCGGGKVINMNEGDANTSNFLIKIDYSKEATSHPFTDYFGFIRFQPDVITQGRVDTIRKQIMAAYYSGEPVTIYSHSNHCSNASQVSVNR